jgi:hypothetical protein
LKYCKIGKGLSSLSSKGINGVWMGGIHGSSFTWSSRTLSTATELSEKLNYYKTFADLQILMNGLAILFPFK